MSRVPVVVVIGVALMALASCSDGGGAPSFTTLAPTVVLSKGPPLSASVAIRNCLNDRGYQSESGPVPASDVDAPDAAVFFSGTDKGTAGEIGIYASEAEASRKLGGIRADAKSSGVLVVPAGMATVIYYTNPADRRTREDVGRCLLRASAP